MEFAVRVRSLAEALVVAVVLIATVAAACCVVVPVWAILTRLPDVMFDEDEILSPIPEVNALAVKVITRPFVVVTVLPTTSRTVPAVVLAPVRDMTVPPEPVVPDPTILTTSPVNPVVVPDWTTESNDPAVWADPLEVMETPVPVVIAENAALIPVPVVRVELVKSTAVPVMLLVCRAMVPSL